MQALQGVKLPLPVDVAFDLRIDARVLAFSLVVAALTGVLAGLLPALKASAPSLVSDLRGEAPAGKVGRRRFALRDALVVSQVALTAVLLVVAGLLLRSLGASQRADVGFDPRGLAAICVRYRHGALQPGARASVFWREALARVRALPGVQSAGLVSPTLPFTFNFSQQRNARRQPHLQRRAARRDHRERRRSRRPTCETLGVPIVDGRGIDETDIAGSPDVAVINETMARTFWPKESAVGHTFATVNQRPHAHVSASSASTRDHKRHGVLERPSPFVYFADAQRPIRLQVHRGAHHRRRGRAAGRHAPRTAGDGAGPGVHEQLARWSRTSARA